MDNEPMIILYLMTYRLAIIVSGIVCIVIGYRLFYKGALASDSSVKIDFSKLEFIFKNVAPGTLFAGFGMIIISLMILSGNPEYIHKDKTIRGVIKDNTSITTEESTAIRNKSTTIRESNYYLELLNKGNEYEKNGKNEKAKIQYQKAINDGMKSLTGVDWLLFANLDHQIKSNLSAQIKNDYYMAVKNSSRAINALAWMYTKNADDMEKGLILARIAVNNVPDEPKYLDTLAELLFQKGEYTEALKMKKKAINTSKPEYKSIYEKGLEKFKNAVNSQ